MAFFSPNLYSIAVLIRKISIQKDINKIANIIPNKIISEFKIYLILNFAKNIATPQMKS